MSVNVFLLLYFFGILLPPPLPSLLPAPTHEQAARAVQVIPTEVGRLHND